MKQYLVETKTKSHLIDADYYEVCDIQDGRRSIFSFYTSGANLWQHPTEIATFNASDVRAIIEQ